jgi:hypothetical protein
MLYMEDMVAIRLDIIKKLSLTGRKGISDLIDYMDNNGFFNAPASKLHHQNYVGGLAEHSRDVYYRTNREIMTMTMGGSKIKPASIAISALLHDLCKIDQYIIESEVKSGNKITGYIISSNHDANWDHAEKSIRLAKQFIELTEEEEMAIRYHMGIYRKEYSWDDFGNAIKKYPLVYLIHVADMKDIYSI